MIVFLVEQLDEANTTYRTLGVYQTRELVFAFVERIRSTWVPVQTLEEGGSITLVSRWRVIETQVLTAIVDEEL